MIKHFGLGGMPVLKPGRARFRVAADCSASSAGIGGMPSMTRLSPGVSVFGGGSAAKQSGQQASGDEQSDKAKLFILSE